MKNHFHSRFFHSFFISNSINLVIMNSTNSEKIIEQYILEQWSLTCLLEAQDAALTIFYHFSNDIRTMYTNEKRERTFTNQLTKSDSYQRKIRNMIRMRLDTFMKLINWFKRNIVMKNSEREEMTVKEKMLIFLYIITQRVTYRNVAEMFHYSTNSIFKIFHEILEFTRTLANRWIQILTTKYEDISLKDDLKRWSFFKECIKALDDSHISMSISSSQQSEWKN